MLPAAGQGILAVQSRADFDRALLACVDDPDSRDCARSERAFVRALGGGCSAPTAAYATVAGDVITLRGMWADARGRLHRGVVSGSRKEGPALAEGLARQLREEAL